MNGVADLNTDLAELPVRAMRQHFLLRMRFF